MPKWKLIKIKDASNYRTFFNEKYGLIKYLHLNICPLNSKGDFFRAYVRVEDGKFTLKNSFDIESIFDTTFYFKKENIKYGYSYLPTLTESQVEKVTDIRYGVTLDYTDCSGFNSSEKFIISDKKELDKFEIWATKDVVTKYERPVFMDLKINQRYYYVGKGFCNVKEIYPDPYQRRYICKAVTSSNEEIEIGLDDGKFVCVPMDCKNENELAIFNESVNELFLQPLVQRNIDGNLINVIWQPIKDAARYIVKLYRYVCADNRRKVYFLKDYEVDRNEHLLIIENLIIDGHIVVVTAENRAGEVVAKSRGIII